MTNLSPTARAVLDAFLGDARHTGLEIDDLRENVAAALRAAALYCKQDRRILMTIAEELDSPNL